MGVKVPENFFGRANTFGSRLPSDNVQTIGVDSESVADSGSGLLIKDLRDEITIPTMSVRIPMIRNVLGHVLNSNRKFNMIVNFLPDWTPRSEPDTRISFVNLNSTILDQNIFYLENGRPKGRFDRSVAHQPEASVMKVFCFEDGSEERILTCGDIPSSMNN